MLESGTRKRWEFDDLELFAADCPMPVKEILLYEVVGYTTVWRAVEVWCSRPESKAVLVDVCRALTLPYQPGAGESADRKIVNEILGAFKNGRLYLLRRRGGALGRGKSDEAKKKAQQSAGKNGAANASAATKEKTWIEIRLIDQDDHPVPNRKYQLKITDGSTRTGTLGDDGSIRVNGIDPGTCEISFLDLDSEEWKPA